MRQNQKTLFAGQRKTSWLDWLLEITGTLPLLLIVGSLPQPLFPEWALWVGIFLIAVNCVLGFSRDFIRGVNDAGGWNNKAPVNSSNQNKDTPSETS